MVMLNFMPCSLPSSGFLPKVSSLELSGTCGKVTNIESNVVMSYIANGPRHQAKTISIGVQYSIRLRGFLLLQTCLDTDSPVCNLSIIGRSGTDKTTESSVRFAPLRFSPWEEFPNSVLWN